MGNVLGICGGFLLGSELGKNIDNQEVLLEGHCVGPLLGVVLGLNIGVSVGKPEDDKIVCRLGRILGIVLNT